MNLGPSLDQAALGEWQGAAQAFDRVEREHCRMLLIVRVKVRAMMGAARFNEHANHDAEKPRQLRHDPIAACGFPFVVVGLTMPHQLRRSMRGSCHNLGAASCMRWLDRSLVLRRPERLDARARLGAGHVAAWRVGRATCPRVNDAGTGNTADETHAASKHTGDREGTRPEPPPRSRGARCWDDPQGG